LAGCRKSSPTLYASLQYIYRFPGGQVSFHQFDIASVSPNFVPEVKFNGRQIPRENIENINLDFGGVSGGDTLPTISPNAEVQMEMKYKDLNEKDKTASSKVKLPSEPSASVKITGGNIRVAWGKPDKKTVSFVYVGIYARCSDGVSYSYNSKDTIITDIENVTEVSRTLGTMCAPISNPVAVLAEGIVVNFYGPWSGSKDNIKGIKGQYYGGAGVYDTTSLYASSRVAKFDGKFNLNREEFFKRMINTIEKHFGVQDEGSWINGF
jgi:hypothetical protein